MSPVWKGIPRLRGSRPAPAVLATLLLLGLLAPDSARAKRIFVPRQHQHLQAAIDAAEVGDTIWVSAGTYYGPFILKKRLLLFGDGGPAETVLDGRDSVRVLHVEGVARGGIYGFRIQRGKAPGGGGIYCLHDTAFAIGSCDIRSNWEAGVSAWQCALIQISDTDISENQGSGLRASDSKLQLTHVNFRKNHGVSGGGISLVSSELAYASECRFEGNRADGSVGGGVSVEDSRAWFAHCNFNENTSAVAGGAVAGMGKTDVRIRSTFFTANRAATGGAVLADHSLLDVQLSIFNKNRATAAGAAIQMLGRRTAGLNPVLISNTFYRNGVDADEGAAIFAQDVSPEITRNIFVVDSTAKNKAVLNIKGTPRYQCNLIYTMDGTGNRPSANTIVGNPSFCDAEGGNFNLKDLSPALGASCGKIGALGAGCTSFRMVPSQ